MDVSVNQENLVHSVLNHDRMKELKAFDDMKAGVKGLADAGMVKIPKIFVRPPVELAEELSCRQTHIQVPVIDFTGIQRDDRRKEIVEKVRIASEKWGIFQVVNHGIPLSVLEKMIDGISLFHEQDLEVKKQFYTRDLTRKAIFNSNFDLYHSRTANWRDTLSISLQASDNLDPNELPATCREAVMDYTKDVKKLGDTLFELLSEGLGLKPDHLRTMECVNGCNIAGHYYPACPEPELTLGLSKHSDPGFLTILLQNQINGLQVLYENQWVDVLSHSRRSSSKHWGPFPDNIKFQIYKTNTPVSLLPPSLSVLNPDEVYCDVCEERVNPNGCIYYCAQSCYSAHLGCLTSASKPHIKLSYRDVDLSSAEASEQTKLEIDHQVFDDRSGLRSDPIDDAELAKLRHRFSQQQMEDQGQSSQVCDESMLQSNEGEDPQLAEPIHPKTKRNVVELEHFSHQHPLTLNNDHDKDNLASCFGCWGRISGLAYGCTQCKFFLHRWCAELPSKVQHPIHPLHSLTLLSRSPRHGFQPACDACYEPM
ncbi:hypothetical protein F0562_000470 [Nyssa sinensis]|uniref:Fe2OG dioxygenase domain-containing protein n=1 Tax=Nyssa sinensis TaxID=561372 RepID=A0A5J5C1K9_9ASTE|nr:hypothetical protein F0562_000470 [Nyssa sinensis]